jgi:hypothetical protein
MFCSKHSQSIVTVDLFVFLAANYRRLRCRCVKTALLLTWKIDWKQFWALNTVTQTCHRFCCSAWLIEKIKIERCNWM